MPHQGIVVGQGNSRITAIGRFQGIGLIEPIPGMKKNGDAIGFDRFGDGGGKTLEQFVQGGDRTENGGGPAHGGAEIQPLSADEKPLRQPLGHAAGRGHGKCDHNGGRDMGDGMSIGRRDGVQGGGNQPPDEGVEYEKIGR